MYFIEAIIKKIKGTRITQPSAEEDDYEVCTHLYLPIDTTGETLACSNCGHVIKKKKNPFNPFAR